jgi:mono/diheme cytochrome c family protein
VPRAKLACRRVGDDVNGMVAQSDIPVLRLLSGPAACMATSWFICMARGVIPPRVIAKVLAPQACAVCHGPHQLELGEARARQILVVRGEDLSEGILLVGNWSEMQPTGQKRDVLPVWVLTRVLSLPHHESWT